MLSGRGAARPTQRAQASQRAEGVGAGRWGAGSFASLSNVETPNLKPLRRSLCDYCQAGRRTPGGGRGGSRKQAPLLRARGGGARREGRVRDAQRQYGRLRVMVRAPPSRRILVRPGSCAAVLRGTGSGPSLRRRRGPPRARRPSDAAAQLCVGSSGARLCAAAASLRAHSPIVAATRRVGGPRRARAPLSSPPHAPPVVAAARACRWCAASGPTAK